MASDEAKRAEQLFMDGMTAAEIEAETGIPANKIRSWKSRYNWGSRIAQHSKGATAQQTKTQQRNATMPKAPAQMGRPTLEIDKKAFEKLCHLQCTGEEIADFFSVDADTVTRWCKREYHCTFAEARARFSTGGKISLRRAQFQLAQKNASMAIHLGKQYLGQRENPSDRPGGGDIEDLTPLAEMLKK